NSKPVAPFTREFAIRGTNRKASGPPPGVASGPECVKRRRNNGDFAGARPHQLCQARPMTDMLAIVQRSSELMIVQRRELLELFGLETRNKYSLEVNGA